MERIFTETTTIQFDLFFDKDVTIDSNLDSGLINPPKIFRRQAPYEILIKAEIEQFSNFKSYLQTLTEIVM